MSKMSRGSVGTFGIAVLASALMGVAACSTEVSPDLGVVDRADESLVVISSESTCVTLFAGQTIDAGSVCASIDNAIDTSSECGAGASGAMNVVFSATGGWEIEEAHLAAGDDLADIPVNRRGNPQIGLFPYSSGDISGATNYAVALPLCLFGLDGADEVCEPVNAYLAAHAALKKDLGDGTYQTETGWGDGDRFVSRGSWAEYFNLTLECEADDDPRPPEPRDCETAFALGADCFLDIDEDGDGRGDFNRWGWRQLIDGSYSAEVYAGAAQCDIEKGTLVGSLDVVVNGDGTVSVTFSSSGGFEMDETHLYIGSGLPTSSDGSSTVAPGQYTDLHEDLEGATSDSYILPGGAGDYLIAHAVVCGDYE